MFDQTVEPFPADAEAALKFVQQNLSELLKCKIPNVSIVFAFLIKESEFDAKAVLEKFSLAFKQTKNLGLIRKIEIMMRRNSFEL